MLVAENTVAVLRHLQPDGGERVFVRKARRAGFDGFWRERRRWKISVFGATPIGNETDFILLPCFIHVFLSGFCQSFFSKILANPAIMWHVAVMTPINTVIQTRQNEKKLVDVETSFRASGA